VLFLQRIVMKHRLLTRLLKLLTLVTLISGCASFTPPKMTLPQVTLPKPPALKMPEIPNVASLNPFSKKPAATATEPAMTYQAQEDPRKNRGFQFSRLDNPITDGPGVRALLMGNAPNEPKARASFARAQQLYQQAQTQSGKERAKTFKEAAKQYKNASDRFVDPSLKEDAFFRAGESYFFADEYPDAVEAFGGLIKNFPSTRYMDVVDGRRFQIAKYWINVDKQDSKFDVLPNLTNEKRPIADAYGNAIKLYDRIRYDNPNGKLADDATMAAAVAHFESERFGEANDLFDDLRKNFPGSDHQFRAHLLGLKTKLQVYAGPDYDGTVLDEAQSIVERMRAAFPDKVKEHEEYLTNALKDVRLKMAEREYAVATFYDNRHEYGAARLYYDQVREDYHDTNLALESEKRMAQIESYPASSETSMDWLADAFPKEHDPQPLLSRGSAPTLLK
jgi:outer membrane protein assembly factor BamD (BamD/ComL family)